MVLAGIESTYTGSSANLMSVKLALDMSDKLFQLIFAGDFIIGAIYLFILLRITPKKYSQEPSEETLLTHQCKFKISALKYICISIVINAICIGLSVVFFQQMVSTFIILAITIFSTIFTHFYNTNNKEEGVIWGEYLLLIFCFLMGLQFKNFEISHELLYICFAFLSVLTINACIYSLFIYFSKASKDEAVIAHIACVYGPPFILLFSKNMKRPDLLAAGIGLGSIGIAIGTFMGLFVYKVLLL